MNAPSYFLDFLELFLWYHCPCYQLVQYSALPAKRRNTIWQNNGGIVRVADLRYGTVIAGGLQTGILPQKSQSRTAQYIAKSTEGYIEAI